MLNMIKKLISAIFNSKLKIAVMLSSASIFLFILFPFNDLGDLVTSQVARLTGNKVFLQFDELKMSALPGPGMKFEQVYLETQGLPGISAKEIKLAPSLSGMIAQKPYGSVEAKGLFKGDVQIAVKSGTKSDNGVERQRVEISAQKLSLQDLRQIGGLPILLKGRLDLNSTALVDFTFAEQPDVDVNLNIGQFELLPSTVPTMMGPLTLPDLKLSTIELKGRLAAGKFIIESGQIGREGDELRGSITGNIAVNLINNNGNLNPVIGGYTFDVDLKAKKSFQERANLFLLLIDSYKSPLADGSEYKFRASAANTMVPPTFNSMH